MIAVFVFILESKAFLDYKENKEMQKLLVLFLLLYNLQNKMKEREKILCNSWCKIHEFFFFFSMLTIYACKTFPSNSFLYSLEFAEKMQFKLYEICMDEWKKKEREEIYFSYFSFEYFFLLWLLLRHTYELTYIVSKYTWIIFSCFCL